MLGRAHCPNDRVKSDSVSLFLLIPCETATLFFTNDSYIKDQANVPKNKGALKRSNGYQE